MALGDLDLQQHAEDQREDGHLGDRVDQRPRPAQHRPLVLPPKLAQCQVDQQVPRLGQVSQRFHGRGGLHSGGSGRARTGETSVPVDHSGVAPPGWATDSVRRHMRILTVSAHYPAQLHQRGHAPAPAAGPGAGRTGPRVLGVRRLAGRSRAAERLGRDRRDAAWRVHWITTTPWTGWDDEHNWHNPGGDRRLPGPPAGGWRPTWSTSTRCSPWAAGLLPAAKASGARVVVTMHDFWWLCARQFLVDTAMRPCSLVVDGRRLRLPGRPGLAAPPRPGPGRPAGVGRPGAGAVGRRPPGCWPPTAWPRVGWQVDENGLPDEVVAALAAVGAGTARRPDPARTRPVRFLYAGGPDPMKGADVLVEAVARLGRDGPDGPGGCRPTASTARRPTDCAGRPACRSRWLEPFDPAELGAMLADHDVLVLASVMRETHSLLTREALAAGLAVVCTDSPGPEEVVVDGDNGLIVPAGDPAALAARAGPAGPTTPAARPAARGRGRAPGRPARSTTRSSGLEARFAAWWLDRGPAGPDDRGRARAGGASVVFATGIDGAPLRYRARLPAEALAGLGVGSRGAATTATPTCWPRPPRPTWWCCTGCRPRCSPGADRGLPRRRHPGGLRRGRPHLRPRPARPRSRPCAGCPPDEPALWMQGVRPLPHHPRGLRRLHRQHRRAGRRRPPQLTGPARPPLRQRGRPASWPGPPTPPWPALAGPVRVRIGYLSGTITHDDDWRFVEPAVVEILDRHPEVELWLVRSPARHPALARVRRPRGAHAGFRPWLRAARGAARPGREPGAAGARGHVQPGQERHQVAGGGPVRHAHRGQPHRAVPPGHHRRRDGLLADTVEDWVDGPRRPAWATRPPGARMGAAGPGATPCWSGHPPCQGHRYLRHPRPRSSTPGRRTGGVVVGCRWCSTSPPCWSTWSPTARRRAPRRGPPPRWRRRDGPHPRPGDRPGPTGSGQPAARRRRPHRPQGRRQGDARLEAGLGR